MKEDQSAEKPENMTIGAFVMGLLRKIYSARKWYLLPLWLLLAIVGVILVLTGHSLILPAIYMAL